MTPRIRAVGSTGVRKATYSPISAVQRRATREEIRRARPSRSQRHSGHSSPHAMRGTCLPHLAQGTSGHPLGDSIAELLRGGVPAEVAGPDIVLHDHLRDGVANPLRPVELADVV